nr:MAG TPA: hypothetical protein [Caudoviricetes sp.]
MILGLSPQSPRFFRNFLYILIKNLGYYSIFYIFRL